ncbi:histidine kinase dimerization/phospho-acceptor domain-containing protein [Melittangium boletus]|uniref:histidine kinase dimerization/phospho-acceptor domain-containing protein n=1 Tax=Melittangium boletus TaxID=83453 RepID=UPI003DA3CCCD
MRIPLDVLDGAWSGQEVGMGVGASGVERLLAVIAEQSLHHGARVGLNALVEAVVRLSGTSGAALYTDDRQVVLSGRAPPGAAREHPWQCFQVGSTTLVVGEPCRDAEERQALLRLTSFGSALLASLAREEAARSERDHLRLDRQRLKELLAHRERTWARAAHDLRTPLLVLQGYIEMMNKGIAGALTPPMQRYLDRMRQSAADLNTRLQNRQRGEAVTTADLRPLLHAAFGPGRPGAARLEVPEEPLRVRVPRPTLVLLVRALERVLVGAGASGLEMRVDVPDDSQVWRLSILGQGERPLPERALTGLERLVRRSEARLEVKSEGSLALTLLLPRVAA